MPVSDPDRLPAAPAAAPAAATAAAAHRRSCRRRRHRRPPPPPPVAAAAVRADRQDPAEASDAHARHPRDALVPAGELPRGDEGRAHDPVAQTGGKAWKVNLRPRPSRSRRAGKRTHRFAVSRTLRARIARALRNARTRRGVKVLVTGTARDAAGKRPRTKTKTIQIRR